MGNSVVRRLSSVSRNANLAMQPKNLVLQSKPNVLTIESPIKSSEAEYELWSTIKSTVLKAATAHQNKIALAISPADEIENLSGDGAKCVQCAPPNTECYLLSPKTWSNDTLEDLGSGMSFELGQLWFFTPTQNNDNVTDLVKTILEVTSREELPSTSYELVGCIADDSLVVWTNYPASDEIQTKLRDDLIKAINDAGVEWNMNLS